MQNNYLRNEIARLYNKYTLCGRVQALNLANKVINTRELEIKGNVDALIVMICFNHNYRIVPFVNSLELNRYRKILSLLAYKRYNTFKNK